MSDGKGCTGSILFSFMLGGLVGAGLTLLFAPMTGQETRDRITDFKDDFKDKTDDLLHDTKDKVSSSYLKGKDYLKDKRSVLTSAIETGKEAYEKEKDRLSKDT
jgi:gas vesicle protein